MSPTKLYFFKNYVNGLMKPKDDLVRDRDYVTERYSVSGSRDVDFQFQPVERQCIVDGELKVVMSDYVRNCHLELISEKIRKSGAKSVLEVGCGTTVNLVLLSEKHPDVRFHGIDYVPERIQEGRKYFGDRLDAIELAQGDVSKLAFEDEAIDLVYSIHCLEQCERIIKDALDNMLRVARKAVVMIEPDAINSTLAQKQFLKQHDYLRSIDKHLRNRDGWDFTHTRLETYFNPLNRSGLYSMDRKA